MSWEVGGPAVCRRTDLRLMDIAGSEGARRQKAEDVMRRIFAEKQKTEEEGAEKGAVTGEASADCTQEASAPEAHPADSEESSTNGSPTVSLEVSGQHVRLIFKKVGC